jgi:hypothetical protein
MHAGSRQTIVTAVTLGGCRFLVADTAFSWADSVVAGMAAADIAECRRAFEIKP